MATKPTDAALWATDANYPNDGGIAAASQTKTAASPTLRARGFRPGRKVAGQIINEWMNNVGRWTEWLKDGVLGAVEFTTLLVTGNATINGNLTVGGQLYHGQQSKPIPYNLATPEFDTDWDRLSANPMWGILGSATTKLRYPVIGLREFDKIHSVGVLYEKGSDAGTTLNMRLVKSQGGIGGSDGFAVVATHAGAAFNAPGHSQMTLSAPDPTIVQAYVSYFIEVWSSTGSNLDGFGSAYVNVSHPA